MPFTWVTIYVEDDCVPWIRRFFQSILKSTSLNVTLSHQRINSCTHGWASHCCLPSSSRSVCTDCSNDTASSARKRASSTPGTITIRVMTASTVTAASVARPPISWHSQA